MLWVGALITLAGVFLSKTSKPLGPTNPNPATTAVKVSRLAGTYNVLKGIPLATAKLGLDMTVGSLGNLITVIAPLHGVVEGTSLISKKYLAPSAYTDLEYAMANSILGAFWITPLEAKRYGNINLASRIKYEDLISRWNSSDSLSKQVFTAGRFAERAYLSGLYGVWARQDIEKGIRDLAKNEGVENYAAAGIDELSNKLGSKINPIRQELEIAVKEKGYLGADKLSLDRIISLIDGSARIDRILDKDRLTLDKSFADNWSKIDKTNIYFSVALYFMNPVAEHLFSNIRLGNFGKGFRAAGKGWEKAMESFLPKSIILASAKEGEFQIKSRFMIL